MRGERTEAWWLNRARREGDAAVGAGLLSIDPVASEVRSAAEETRIAFARFVELSRRERGLSVEKLAEAAQLDVGELVSIEEDLDYRPEPRTIYKLAMTFSVPQQSLMQLAGLTVANDDHLRHEAVKFAARSESVEKLTREQKSALEAFVAVLSQKAVDQKTK